MSAALHRRARTLARRRPCTCPAHAARSRLLPPARPRSTAPGIPVIASSLPKAKYWNVTWNQGSAGDPSETYAVKCVLAGQPYTSTAVGASFSGIPRIPAAAPAGYNATASGPWSTLHRAQVTGLNSETAYSCFVIASNVGSTVASVAYSVTTLAP